MSDKSLFTELFSEVGTVPRERFSDWFDDKTKTFGGSGAIETVKALVGNAAKFDYQGLKEIPALDLPALRPFFDGMLVLNGRRPMWKDDRLTFKTHEAWITGPAVRRHYQNAVFGRAQAGSDSAMHVIGVGHAAFDNALNQALEQDAALSAVKGVSDPIVVAKVFDRVTASSGTVSSRVFGVRLPEDPRSASILSDDELLVMLNDLKARGSERIVPDVDGRTVEASFTRGLEMLTDALSELKLPFSVPDVQPLGMLWPASTEP